jgi:uncharacterized protein YijF (DUF1287 family)
MASLAALGLATSAGATSFGERLASAAAEQSLHRVIYDGSYVSIPYPWGDVAADRGVCADVIVRAYRALGVDLQVRVHEDMAEAFPAYPDDWGLTRPDSNIDHRRVLNLETYFTRAGGRLPASDDAEDYEPGDVIAWRVRVGRADLPHMGVVVDQIGPSGRPMVVHNIGRGPQVEDVLFEWPMTGRYRYTVAAGEEDRLPASSVD